MGHVRAAGLIVLSLMGGCAGSLSPVVTPDAVTLADTSWRLVEVRPSGPGARPIRPSDPWKYEMTLGSDGLLAMRLDCNRAMGPWSSTMSAPGRGLLTMEPLAMTRAACPAGSLDERIAQDARLVRTYELEGRDLRLGLADDRGVYIWRRAEP